MIGKTIKSILAANTTLTALIPALRMYPYVMNEDTTLPALVYTIDSVDPTYTKKEWVNDVIEFSVHSFGRDYGDLQDIASAVRGALELNETGSGTNDINRIYMTGMEESYDVASDVFYNKLKFKVTINTY